MKMASNQPAPVEQGSPPATKETPESAELLPSGIPPEFQTLLNLQDDATAKATADKVPEIPENRLEKNGQVSPTKEALESVEVLPSGIPAEFQTFLDLQSDAVAKATASRLPEIPETRPQKNEQEIRNHPAFARWSRTGMGAEPTPEQKQQLLNGTPPIVLSASDGKPGFSSGIQPSLPQETQQVSAVTNWDDAEMDPTALMASMGRELEKDFEPSIDDKLRRLEGEIMDRVEMMLDSREGV